MLALLGPCGCGKTTLLRLIAGFERPDAGPIVGGRVLAGPGRFVAPERRRVGIVFQDYALFPHLTVERTSAFGCRARAREDRERVTLRSLELVGLQHKADQPPARAVRRRAPARGPRARARARAGADPAGRALLEPRRDAAGGLRREVELILRDAGRHGALRDARPGGGALPGRPAGGDARGADRAGGRARGCLRRARPTAGPRGFVGEVNVLPAWRAARGRDRARRVRRGRARDGSVHVAVRPEQLELRADDSGNAEVVAREFRGHDVLYRLRHEGGRTVLVQLPSLELHEVGARVFVRPVADAVTCLVD